MKKILLIILVSITSFSARSQVTNNQLSDFIQWLRNLGKNPQQIQDAVNGVINNPELYNTLWKNFIDQAMKQDSSRWVFLRDMNVQFKTFQSSDNAVSSLGFSYDFNYDYAKYTERNQNRVASTFSLAAKGNVAFNKVVNPNDFLETELSYSRAHFIGGVVTQSDTAVFSRLNAIEDQLAKMTDMQSPEAVQLWEDFGKNMAFSNQYYYALAPKFALESNQDFSKKQFTPGLAIDLSAKAWDKNSPLSAFNLFDYPFALLRLITGTDKVFTPYGSTIPTAQFTLDYVIPTTDTVRKALTGNTDPFPRIKFETSFRTFITRIEKENIFFNANFRYYQELGAPKSIVAANLDINSYFVMALQSSSGLYVSYANGKLPFDAKSDEVYSIGFNYKFK